MQRARVNLVTVGVFAWSRLEPHPGRYNVEWLAAALTGYVERGGHLVVTFLFALNRTDGEQELDGGLTLPPGGVAIVEDGLVVKT
jgi:hypothetical protein